MTRTIRSGLSTSAALCLAGLTGCASPEFAPVDVEPTTPTELAATWHDLQLDGRDLGDVKVWSRGRPEPPADGADAARQLHIALRIRNDGPHPLRLDLDATELEVHARGDRAHLVGPPLEVRGPTEVAAGGIERTELIYALPEGVKLRQVVGFELAWAVLVETTASPAPAAATPGRGTLEAGAERAAEPATVQRRISRSSVFHRVRDDRGDWYYPYDRWGRPYYGTFYDPWYDGPYGLHFGWGVNYGW